MQRLLIVVCTGVLLLLGGVALAAPGAAQPAPRYFPETQHWVGGRFLQYWQEHGGLAQQGYPLTEEFQEQSPLDGQTRTVQYFERAVFEYHPENAGTPYEVLLAQLGTYELKARYPNGAPGGTPHGNNPQVFPQTGRTLGGLFLGYWENHGGLAQQGYPLTEEFSETNKLTGAVYTVQYFERAIFEYHPENVGTPYEVLLTQLGKYQLDSRYPNNSNPAAAPAPGAPPATQAPAPVTVTPAPATAIPGVPTAVLPTAAPPVPPPPAHPSPTRVGTNCGTVAPARQDTTGHTGSVWISYLQAQGQEYVEIYNGGGNTVDLGGWVLRDKNETDQAYRFAEGTTLASGAALQVYTEPGHPYTFNSNNSIWNNCGDVAQLLDPSSTVVATLAYGTHCLGTCP